MFTRNLLEAIRDLVQEMLPFLYLKYKLGSNVSFLGFVIASLRGVNQGGPASTDIFNLVLSIVLKTLNNCFQTSVL